jgi:ribosome-binding protein aMBF1 (putative translation factor)
MSLFWAQRSAAPFWVSMSKPRRTTSKQVWARAYDEFRERLVVARTDAGLTQRKAADLLGRTQSFVAKCETGERRVDIVELLAFARVYRRDIRAFLPPEKP